MDTEEPEDRRIRFYNLTPLDETWGPGLRLLEIVVQTVGLAFWPLFAAAHWLLKHRH